METAQHDKHVALIRACKLGDRMAQHALFKAYAKAMLNTSIRIVKDHAQAEDVVQEAFIEVFTRMHLFREDSSFGYWLKQIVVNRSISALRQNKQAQWMNTEDLADSQMLSLYQEDAGYQDYERINPELAESRAIYDDLVQQRKDSIRVFASQDLRLEAEFVDALSFMELNYEQLKAELQHSPNQERTLRAMILNLQAQAEVLNQQLYILSKLNETKNETL